MKTKNKIRMIDKERLRLSIMLNVHFRVFANANFIRSVVRILVRILQCLPLVIDQFEGSRYALKIYLTRRFA